MADIGRWSGGAKSQGALPAMPTWAAPSDLFSTEDDNPSSMYTFVNSTSTLTLPSSNLADGYLIVASYVYEDTSNGRHQPQLRINRNSGTGDFSGARAGGYSRDNSENEAYVKTWAFVNNPSASSTYQVGWSCSGDTATGGTQSSELQVIPFYYKDYAYFGFGASKNLAGGTTPVVETNMTEVVAGTNISHASGVITLEEDNTNYLVLGGQWSDGAASNRTQRWYGLDIDGTQDRSTQANVYLRDSANHTNGGIYTTIVPRVTTDITLEHTCYRGDGVSNNQGGADADSGTTATYMENFCVVLALNDSADVFKTTGSTSLAVNTVTDVTYAKTGDIDFNDSASFTRASDTAINCVQTGDMLFGANLSGASASVSDTARATYHAMFSIAGTDAVGSKHGNYTRNNQGTIDTFGGSVSMLSSHAVTAGDDLTIPIQRISGGETGSFSLQSGWVGVWGINLDTLEAGSEDVLLADDVESDSEVSSPSISEENALTSDNVESSSEVSSPVVGQVHTLVNTSVESGSEVSSPIITEVHALLPISVESNSEVTTPDLATIHALAATSVESNSAVTTPVIAQAHVLLVTSVESSSEVTDPVIAQAHTLLSTSVESGSEVSNPVVVGFAGTDNLLADSVESGSEVSGPVAGQSHTLLNTSVESNSEVSSPAINQVHDLLVTSLESASEVNSPGIGEENALTATNVESDTEVTNPVIAQSYSLTATSVESSSEVSTPTATHVMGVHGLSATSIESATEVSAPVIAQVHVLAPNDVESATEVTNPVIAQVHDLFSSSLESNSEVSNPVVSSSGADDLLADDIESATEVSSPVLAQVHTLNVTSVESGSEVTSPVIGTIHNLFTDSVESSTEVSVPVIAEIYNFTSISVESASEVGTTSLNAGSRDIDTITIAKVETIYSVTSATDVMTVQATDSWSVNSESDTITINNTDTTLIRSVS